VDDTVTAGTLRGLAHRLLKTSLMEYLTAPVAKTAERDGQSVVLLDDDGARALFTAVREDRIGDYVTRNGAANSVDAVR
jgi:hypothetical protein